MDFISNNWEWLLPVLIILVDKLITLLPVRHQDLIISLIKGIAGAMSKKTAIFIFALLLLPTLAFAAPFLVCDPQPKTDVTHYVITGDINVTIPAKDLGDGTVRLVYDLGNVAEGPYDLQVKAKNEWGESVAVPFDFVKALPVVPENIRIE